MSISSISSMSLVFDVSRMTVGTSVERVSGAADGAGDPSMVVDLSDVGDTVELSGVDTAALREPAPEVFDDSGDDVVDESGPKAHGARRLLAAGHFKGRAAEVLSAKFGAAEPKDEVATDDVDSVEVAQKERGRRRVDVVG